jgi:hypothetical protein
MLRLLLIALGGWMAFSTVLGLFLARVIGNHHALEARPGGASQQRPRHAA